MDKFQQIKAFVNVVTEGGFAAASRKLEVSRSTLNKSVIQLEQELGVQLLYRSTRQVKPTASGMAFYQRCVTILADLREAELAISRFHHEPRGILRINAPMTFGTLYLGEAIADFMIQYPQVQVQLTLEDRFVDPIGEGYDVVVRIAQPSEISGLIVHPIAEVEQVLCASPDYLQREGIPTHPSQLSDRACLHYGYLATGNHWQLYDANKDYKIAIRGKLCSNNGEILRDAAIKGLGIALLPTFIIEAALREQTLEIILPDYRPFPIAICVIYPTNRHLSAKVSLLTDFLQQRFNR